jgi:hypothetical protein
MAKEAIEIASMLITTKRIPVWLSTRLWWSVVAVAVAATIAHPPLPPRRRRLLE